MPKQQHHFALITLLAIVGLNGLCAFAQTATPSVATTQPTTQPTSQPTRLDVTDAKAIATGIGHPVVIFGRVSSAKLSSTGKVFRIEFEGASSSGFVAVIFDRSLKGFEGPLGKDPGKALEGRRVELTGTLELYKGKPE